MPFVVETLLVVVIVAVAATYVVRAFLPRKKATPGCGGCPSNPARRDDYT